MIIKRDQTFIYVCSIRTPFIKDGRSLEKNGTGIFIVKDDNYYLLTAEHVSAATNENSYIVLCDIYNNSNSISLKTLNATLSWKVHSEADMAVLSIDKSANPWITTRAFPYDHCEISMANFNRDIELTTVGFPCGLGVDGKFSPLTFRSHPASNILRFERFDNKKPSDFFCLEDPSIGGYSGGPSFDLSYIVNGNITQSMDKTRLYGIMHGYIGDGGAMACVTPIYYLADIV